MGVRKDLLTTFFLWRKKPSSLSRSLQLDDVEMASYSRRGEYRQALNKVAPRLLPEWDRFVEQLPEPKRSSIYHNPKRRLKLKTWVYDDAGNLKEVKERTCYEQIR